MKVEAVDLSQTKFPGITWSMGCPITSIAEPRAIPPNAMILTPVSSTSQIRSSVNPRCNRRRDFLCAAFPSVGAPRARRTSTIAASIGQHISTIPFDRIYDGYTLT